MILQNATSSRVQILLIPAAISGRSVTLTHRSVGRGHQIRRPDRHHRSTARPPAAAWHAADGEAG
jgi:hypothetical protein